MNLKGLVSDWISRRLPRELRVVEIIQIVESPHGVVAGMQPLARVRADETRAAGDQEIRVR